MKQYILFNPHAGNGTAEEAAKKLAATYSDAVLLDMTAIDGYASFMEGVTAEDTMTICGGDGTLFRFANNAYGLDFPCPVCVIRSGTGNDFLNDIGQMKNDAPVDIREYLKNLPEVKVNGQTVYCINGAGLGMDGAVCYGVEEFKRKTNKKKANYTIIALKELCYKYKRPKAKLTVDGKVFEYDDVWAMSTMKGKYYGGGMMISPSQDRRSGKVSVMAMHGGARLRALSAFSKIKTGAHIKYTDIVEIFEGYDVLVEFDRPCYMQIDGEVFCDVQTYEVHCARPEGENT